MSNFPKNEIQRKQVPCKYRTKKTILDQSRKND